ncbi:MAG TPA: hypothetical protein VMW24_02375 [Sedimentisphaerales bacterium]|nr:hypothetical protein [Sedimentisphaerales bacterium]
MHRASLYRYFIWADRLREYFEKAIVATKDMESSVESTWADDYGLFMAHWYGALYVVVEGWRVMGLKDTVVDTLLESPNVALLKQFRHATFHFQKEYFDVRFAKFWHDSKETVPWIRQLNGAFGQFFLKEMGSRAGLNIKADWPRKSNAT